MIFVTAGGGFRRQSAALLKQCPQNIHLAVVGPKYLEGFIRSELNERQLSFQQLPFARRQDRDQTFLGSIPAAILGTISALTVLLRERPDALVVIAQRAGAYFLIAARLLRIHSVFIESLTRVTTPSTTAKLVARFRLADRIYVQWPQLAKALPRSIYLGRLV
ncbi:MAG: hypothetical protein ACYC0X_00365 [Pirellulaceae bacterium]